MANSTDVSIALRLSGIQEALEALQSVRAALNELGGAAGSSGLSGLPPGTPPAISGGSGAAIIARPAAHTSHPTSLSTAASVAGSPMLGEIIASAASVPSAPQGYLDRAAARTLGMEGLSERQRLSYGGEPYLGLAAEATWDSASVAGLTRGLNRDQTIATMAAGTLDLMARDPDLRRQHGDVVRYDWDVGRWQDIHTGSYYLHRTQAPNVMAYGGEVWQALGPLQAAGAAVVGHQVLGYFGQAAQMQADALASGGTFRPQLLEPAQTGIGISAVGGLAAAGAAYAMGAPLGPIGIAAATGFTVTNAIYGAFFQPQYEAEVQREVATIALGERMRGYGRPLPEGTDYSKSFAGAADQLAAAGMPPSIELLRQIGGGPVARQIPATGLGVGSYWDMQGGLVPDSKQGEFLKGYMDLRMDPAVVARLGMGTQSGIDPQVLQMGIYSSPLGVAALGAILQEGMQEKTPLLALGLSLAGSNPLASMIDRAQQSFVEQQRFKESMQLNQSQMSLASTQLGFAGRFGGSAGFAEALPGALSAMSEGSTLLRAEAERARSFGHETQARLLENQAAQIDLQAKYAPAAGFDLRMQEVAATGGLAIGRADREFQGALYSGASARDLPWEGRSNALMGQARQMEIVMAEKRAAGFLSPAEEAQFKEQIESMRFMATTQMARDRETAIIGERFGEQGLSAASRTAASMDTVLLGSSGESRDRVLADQVANLREERQLMQEILQTSQYLTREERLRYETQLKGLDAREKELEHERAWAGTSSRLGLRGTESIEARTETAIAELRGGATFETRNQGITDTQSTRALLEQEYQMHLDRGESPDSERMQGLRRQIAGETLSIERQKRAMAVLPETPEMRIESGRLGVERELLRMGLGGSYGDIQGNITASMQNVQSRIAKLDADKRAFMRERGAEEWSPEMEADYQAARNGAGLEMAGLFKEYDAGFTDRMISEAYNMPSQGRLMRSQFTPAEAMMQKFANEYMEEGFAAGYGGTEGASRGARQRFPRMLRSITGSNVGGFIEEAMSGAAGGTAAPDLTVRVIIQDNSGKELAQTIETVHQGRTERNVTVNADQSKRPGG